ncbi:Phenazine biosynthesis-like domain-containing protein [Galemys pyrenaicus]|uniref:Phenazine biosynthesis-like domain-containing protein n=1 Tax=Galemys pyrenaicus TaxID=202257 RepID=A0A8J6DGB9_GALPY|nr:Phenazine biosynthesis-like domain-containing protein [Galemys pyrenaicus]
MAEAKPAGKRKKLDDPRFGARLRPLNSPRASSATYTTPASKWEIAREAQPDRLRAATSTLPPTPRPAPISFVLLPIPFSKLPAQPTPFLLQIPCWATVVPTPVLAGSGLRREQTPASSGAPHNGPPNRLWWWQPLRELRSTATGLGGWEGASEEEGVEREQRKPASPALARLQRPALARAAGAVRLSRFFARLSATYGRCFKFLFLIQELDEDLHQKIAKEMNLSETAFIRKLHSTDNFTQKNMNSTLTFVTLSGELKARKAENGIILDLPLYPANPQDFREVENLIKTAIGDTMVQDIRYSPDTRKLLVRLSDTYDRSFLENLKVSTENLPQIENSGKVKGLILTLKGQTGGQTKVFDFYTRYFAPWLGVAEDPVTAFQCSPRGGELEISLRSDGRVDIGGGAAIVLEGTLTA